MQRQKKRQRQMQRQRQQDKSLQLDGATKECGGGEVDTPDVCSIYAKMAMRYARKKMK